MGPGRACHRQLKSPGITHRQLRFSDCLGGLQLALSCLSSLLRCRLLALEHLIYWHSLPPLGTLVPPCSFLPTPLTSNVLDNTRIYNAYCLLCLP